MKLKIKSPLLALLFLSAYSLQAKNIEIKNEAFMEKEEKAKDGKIVKKLVPVKTVVPGNEVIFVITYKNTGKETVSDVVVTNPIPENMTFKAAESAAKATTEYSVDGGKTYGQLASLKVTDKLRKVRPALQSDVTHVRWKILDQVAPSAQNNVKLIAVLK